MNILFIGIIVYVVLLVVMYLLIKSVIKAVLFAGTLISIALIVLGIFVYLDLQDIKNTDTSYTLLTNENKIIAGFSSSAGVTTPLNQEQLDDMSQDYAAGDLDSLHLIQNSRVVLFDADLVPRLDQFTLVVLATNITQQQIVSAFLYDDDAKVLQETLYLPDITTVRNVLFSELLQQRLSGKQNLILILTYLQEDLVEFHPNSIAYKTLATVPIPVASKILN